MIKLFSEGRSTEPPQVSNVDLEVSGNMVV